MANATTEQRVSHAVDYEEKEHQLVHHREQGVVARREAVSGKRVSRLAVEGGVAGMTNKSGRDVANHEDEKAARGRRLSGIGGRTLPPPHAWLAIEDTSNKKHRDVDPEEQWLRLLRGGGCSGDSISRQRRSSFSVVRHERAAHEAWLDRAWEMKRSWHARNGGAPDADMPVVVVVGKHHHDQSASSELSSEMMTSEPHHHHAQGGVAMDVDEVRACRDLGLELPSDCTVEIQCYGLSDGSPTHTNDASSGADSPCAGISSAGVDPMDVKARLKVWAQAVALTSTTQLGS